MARRFLHGVMAGVLALLPALASAALPAALQARLGTGTPSAEQLAAFFSGGRATIDTFCAGSGSCTPAREKDELYRLFFRGSFAQPSGDSMVHARPDGAYAEQAVAYFTEPDYACRRPLTARVLESLWQLSPAAADCPARVPFVLDEESGTRRVQYVDPERVAAVHLLFAGGDGRAFSFSRFGHTGLRLIVCNDSRQAVGEACDMDLFDHLALGFRAAVDELDLSLWKGISGGYPLQLFASPFMQAYSSYTQDEFREVSSLPLTLEPAARELLVRALAEVQWSYRNDYRFFSQNCASELAWLLRVVNRVSGTTEEWLADGNVRPDRLYRRALASPAFNAARLADLKQAERDGFYFPGSAPYYQVALDTLLQRAATQVAEAAVRDFEGFRGLDADARRRLYDAALAAAPETRARSAHAALVLEAWIERRQRRALMAQLSRYYLELTGTLLAKTDYFDGAERALLTRCMKGAGLPPLSATGVPAAPDIAGSGCDFRSAAFQAALEKLWRVALAGALQQDRIAELQATVGLVNWLLPQTGLIPSPTPALVEN
jgi:hypothetical protein